MKKNNFVGMLALILTWMVSPAFGVQYDTDFLEPGNQGGASGSLKTFDEAWTIGLGDTFAIDIWVTDLPESIISSGFLMTYNPDQVSIVSVQAYDSIDITGPWDGDATVKISNATGPGSYALELAQLGCAEPDAGGDIIVAKVTFQCLGLGSAAITLSQVPDFDTTVGCNSSVVFDNQMGSHAITINQQQQGTSSTTSSSGDSTSTTTTPSADTDDDGIADNQDNCPDTPNGPDLGTCTSGINIGAVCGPPGGYNPIMCGQQGPYPYCSIDQEDSDNDGVGDACDNCPAKDNSDQEDTDCDGIGDACDATSTCTKGVDCDAECDGKKDQDDNCPNIPNGPKAGTCTAGTVGKVCKSNEACGTNGVCSMNQEDMDADGIGDLCDNCPNKPNGPDKGTCTEDTEDNVGKDCVSNEACGANGFCSMNQEDADEDKVGDACDDRIMLSVSDGAGNPGSTNIPVAVSLDNSKNIVRDVQINLCDVGNFLTCTECETTNRTSGYSCSFNEVDGCCRVMLENPTSDDASIAKGTGSIFTINYNVSSLAPSDECREVKPSDEKVTGDNNVSLPADSKLGNFCFYTTTTTTTAYPLEVEAYAARLCRSFLFPLPYLLVITSSDGFFYSPCYSEYVLSESPSESDLKPILHFPIGRINKSCFWDMSWVMPGVLRGLTNEEEEITVIMTCKNAEAKDVVGKGTFTIGPCIPSN